MEEIYQKLGVNPRYVSRKTWEKGFQIELKEHFETVEHDLIKIGGIVLDHLEEDLNYYDYLEEMENKMDKNKEAVYGMAKGIYCEIFMMHEGHKFIDSNEIKDDILSLKNFGAGYIVDYLWEFFNDSDKSVDCWDEILNIK